MRTASGLTGAALPLAGAAIAFPLGWPVAGILLVGVALVIAAGTFAPQLPVIHRLPLVGAHRPVFTFSIDGDETLIVKGGDAVEQRAVLRVGISNERREDLKDTTINFLVPETVELSAVKSNGEPSGKGEVLPPTAESLRQRADGSPMLSNYWSDSGFRLPGRVPTLFHFRLVFREPGLYPVRAKLVAENLYKEVTADAAIRVEKPSEEHKPPVTQQARPAAVPRAKKVRPSETPSRPQVPDPAPSESLADAVSRELAFGKQLRDGLPTQAAPSVLAGVLWAGQQDVQAWIERVAFLFAEHDRDDLRSSFLRASPPNTRGSVDPSRTLAETLVYVVRASGPSRRREVEAKLARLDRIRRRL